MEPQSRELIPRFYNATADLPRLRVLLDARKLGHGGIGMYVENLIHGFLELGVELTVIGQRASLLRFGLLDYVGIIDDDAQQYSLNELFLLGRRLDQREFDVFHSPHFTLPYGLRIPTVVTVHDLIHVHQPERFYYPIIARPLIRSALRRATRVVTVSESSRADILKLMGKGNFGDKICVVPNAVDPIFEYNTYASSERAFLLAVISNSKPHKGLTALIEGFQYYMASAAPSAPAGLKLLVAGDGAARLADLHGAIVPVGHISREKLARLYREALAVVVPSRAEGFCLPALEAHASGTPVISTPVAAVREILTDSDVLCAGYSAGDIASGINTFFESSRLRKEKAHRDASLWSGRYSRGEIARRVLGVYSQAVNGAGLK